MLKKTLILATLSLQIVSAQSIESILKLVDTNNYNLKEKQTQIQSSKINVDLSEIWQNPVLGFGVNDINIDEPTSRDIEAMQTQFITYSQNIPTNGKLQSLNKIQTHNLNIKKIEFNDYKQKLKSKVMEYSYIVYYEKEKLKIINQYIINLNKQKELMALLYENGKIDQSKLVSIDIRIYKLKLQKQKINYKVSQFRVALENIVFQKITDIEISNNIENSKIDLSKVLNNHPLVLIEKEKIKQQQENTYLEEKKTLADVKLTVGYYNREKFDDYLSFNVAIPLSIQGREKLKIKKSQVNTVSLKNNLKSLQQQIKTTIENLEEKQKTSKQNFDLIENTMIPLNDTLEQSHTIHLSTNMMNSLSIYESKNSKYDLLLLISDEKN